MEGKSKEGEHTTPLEMRNAKKQIKPSILCYTTYFILPEDLEYEIYIDLKLVSEYILDDTIFIHPQIKSLKGEIWLWILQMININ